MTVKEFLPAVAKYPQLRKVVPFVQDGVLYVLHDPQKHMKQMPDGVFIPTTKIFDYISESGADPNIIRRVFSPEGELIHVVDQEFDIRQDPFGIRKSNSIENIRGFLEGTVALPMRLINQAIAGPEKKVKNDHELGHALDVTDKGVNIMAQVGTPPDEQAAGVVAFMLHDIGNILSRDFHAYFSVLLWRKFYPNLILTEKQEQLIDQAIIFHNGDVFFDILKQKKGMTFAEVINWMRAELADPALALILADKGALGIERLPNVGDPEDLHRTVNLYARTHELNYNTDLEHFFWVINFGEGLTHDQLQRFSQFVVQRADGKIVRRTPREIKKGIEELQSTEFEEWEKVFWATYFPRNMLLVIAALAMSDFAKDVNIVIRDISGSGPAESVKLYTFSMDRKNEKGEENEYYAPKQMHKIWSRLPQSMRERAEYKLFASF